MLQDLLLRPEITEIHLIRRLTSKNADFVRIISGLTRNPLHTPGAVQQDAAEEALLSRNMGHEKPEYCQKFDPRNSLPQGQQTTNPNRADSEPLAPPQVVGWERFIPSRSWSVCLGEPSRHSYGLPPTPGSVKIAFRQKKQSALCSSGWSGRICACSLPASVIGQSFSKCSSKAKCEDRRPQTLS
jgi:hypothetical protein